MSRCYPFPPPGYIKNAPVELGLPSKKEKHKHKDKDKKKKRKKHSATNGDLSLQDKDRSLKDIQQSGQAIQGSNAGNERLLEATFMSSAAINQGAIERLQTDNFGDKAFSNCVLASNSERPEQRLQSVNLRNEPSSHGALVSKLEKPHAENSRVLSLSNGTDGGKRWERPEQRVQSVNLRNEVPLHAVLASNCERMHTDDSRVYISKGTNSGIRPKTGFQPRNPTTELLTNSGLASNSERMHASADDSRVYISKGTNSGIRPKEGFQPRNPTTEVLTNSGLASNSERMHTSADDSRVYISKGTNSGIRPKHRVRAGEVLSGPQREGKRLKADNSTVLSNGLLATTSCERPKGGSQADISVHEVFSNGVLSAKRKRLQADNSRDNLFPNGGLASDRKRPDGGLQTGNPNYEDSVEPTNSMRLQADSSSSKFLSNNVRPVDSERLEQRSQVDSSSMKLISDVVPLADIQAHNGKAKEVSHRLWSTSSGLQGESFKHEGLSNGVLATKGQKSHSLRGKMHSNGMLAVRCNRSEQSLQPENKSLLNGIRDTDVRTSQASNVSKEGAVLATNCDTSEQRFLGDISKSKVLPNDVPSAKTNRLQAGNSKAHMISHGVHATSCEGSEQRLRSVTSLHEVQGVNGVLDVKAERLQADKSRNKTLAQGMLATSNEISDPRLHADKSRNKVPAHGVLVTHNEISHSKLQADELRKEVLSNGVLATSKCAEFNSDCKVDGHLSSLVASGDDGAGLKDVSPVSRVSLQWDNMLIKLRRPNAEQVWTTVEDEDWLTICNNQLQSKPKENQIPQVWAEAVLLPSIGLNALPFVVAD